MSLLTYLVDAKIRDSEKTLTGKTLTRPSLFASDATSTTYVVNVDLGEGNILYNVPVATGNNELRYAEAGSPVKLDRTEAGRWMVTGFSKVMPGTYNRIPVTIPDFDFGIPQYTTGAVEKLGLTVRPLTYGELETNGGYGRVPYGAVGLFKDGTLLEIY